MRGLNRFPRSSELVEGTNRLQTNHSIPADVFALYTQWARLDPRFAEIVVTSIARTWQTLALGDFMGALEQSPWPQAAVVLFRFAALDAKDSHLTVMCDALAKLYPPRSSHGLFFIPLTWPNSVVTRNELKFNTKIYARSGFIGSQALRSRGRWPIDETHLTRSARRQIFKTPFASKPKVSVTEYRDACRNMISTRQAQRDNRALIRVV